jgi:hypothetical protein
MQSASPPPVEPARSGRATPPERGRVASAAKAIAIGFDVRPTGKAAMLAEAEAVARLQRSCS